MPSVETYTTGADIGGFKENAIYFYRTNSLPRGLYPQVEAAVRDFTESSRIKKVDKEGLYLQTLEAFANITVNKGAGDLWIGTQNGKLLVYVMASVLREVDGKLTYWVSQGWVDKSMRGSLIVKDWWQQIRERAKECFCKHVVVVSSRGTKAYCRWLGPGFHPHLTILKEDL